MCLEILDKVYKRVQTDHEVVGYKVFESLEDNEDLLFDFFSYKESFTVPCGKWLKAEQSRTLFAVSRKESREYPCGFHVFLTRKAAKGWKEKRGDRFKVVKVRARGLLAIGQQGRDKRLARSVGVFYEMFVPRKGEE